MNCLCDRLGDVATDSALMREAESEVLDLGYSDRSRRQPDVEVAWDVAGVRDCDSHGRVVNASVIPFEGQNHLELVIYGLRHDVRPFRRRPRHCGRAITRD